jgi:ketosteroid isomerase-like protein
MYATSQETRAKATVGLALCLAAVAGTSCSQMAARGSHQNPTREAAVRHVMDVFFAESLRQDWDAVGRVMTDDFEIFTDDAIRYRKQEYVDLLKADDLRLGRYRLDDLHIGVAASDDYAWMTYRGYFESTSHGKFSRVATLETLMFRKDSGEWKLFRAQATISDLDKPTQ